MHIGGIWSFEAIPSRGHWTFTADRLRLHLGSYVTTVHDEQCLFAIEGQMYDASVPVALERPEHLQTAYGYYAYVRYDKLKREATIGTDRFGYFPLYYAQEDGHFIFGSSLEFVKGHLRRRSPDYEAWEELLTLGEVIGNKSTVRQIKRLGPGTQIKIRDDRVGFNRYWQPELPDQVSESQYIRDNNTLLDEAMCKTRSQARRKVVLLSGGEDSRRLALAAVRAELDVSLFTQESIYKGRYREHVDRDVKLATHLATVLARPHVITSMPDNAQYLVDSKMRDTSLGFECIAHEWLLPLVRQLGTESLIYDGIVGDVTINGHYFKEFPDALNNYRDPSALARMICGDALACFEEIRRRTETPLLDRVRELLASYPESPHRLTFYVVLNHARRKISLASQLFASRGHWTCYPYLYYPLFVQSLSLDPRLALTKFYQRECMAAVSPDVLSVPTTRGDVPAEWLIPMNGVARRQQVTLLRHLRISDAALELFPTFRSRYRVMHALRDVSGGILRRFGWFIPPIARFSAFLEWLEADDERTEQQ